MQQSSLNVLLLQTVLFVEIVASFVGAQTTPCDSNPCLHGGACLSSADLSEFICDCQGQWSGVVCETGCNEHNTELLGNITSPNYPSFYNNRADCEYIIDIPNGLKITITFNFFDLGLLDNTQSEYDKLEYGSGSQSGQNLLGEFTSNNIPDSFEIEGGAMWFHFRTSGRSANARGKGFLILWNATGLCGEPRMYPNSSYTLEKEDSYAVGSTANYTCVKGFTMVDDDNDYSVHKCELSSTNHLVWTGPEFKCKEEHKQSLWAWILDKSGLSHAELMGIVVSACIAIPGGIATAVYYTVKAYRVCYPKPPSPSNSPTQVST